MCELTRYAIVIIKLIKIENEVGWIVRPLRRARELFVGQFVSCAEAFDDHSSDVYYFGVAVGRNGPAGVRNNSTERVSLRPPFTTTICASRKPRSLTRYFLALSPRSGAPGLR